MIYLFLIAIVLYIFTRFSNISLTNAKTGSDLVVKKFDVDESMESETVISIVGRQAGIYAWFLSILKIDDETSLTVYRNRIEFKSTTLYGHTLQITPLFSVASTSCGYVNPAGPLIIAVLAFLTGVAMTFIDGGIGYFLVGLLIAAAFVYIYIKEKNLMISVESNGGTIMQLYFIGSPVESVYVDLPKIRRTIEIINDLVCKSQELQQIKSSAP